MDYRSHNPAMTGHRSLKDVTIHRLLLSPTGTYNQMVRRPLQSAIDGVAMERLNSASLGGLNLTATALGGVASSFLQPSFQYEAFAGIENGWNQQRFTFMMEVTINQHNTIQRRILTGYTEHNDAIIHGNGEALLPAEMMFYVNNSVILREVMANIGGQQVCSTNQVTSDQILRGNYARGNYANSDKTMRPCDALSVNAIDFATNGAFTNGSQVIAVDHRPGFGCGIQRASRANMNPAAYLSKSLSAIQSAFGQAGNDSNIATIFNSAAGIVKEFDMKNDQLLSVIGRDSDVLVSGRFCWQDLLNMDPTINQRFQLARQASNVASPIPVHNTGDTANWDDMSTGSRAHEATIVGNCLTALMNDCYMMAVGFFATNDTVTGQWDFRYLSEPMGFSEFLDMTPYMMAFKDRFIVECLDGISMYGQRRLTIQVFADQLMDTQINLAMDSDTAMMPYCIPSHADQLFSPFVTTNNQRLLDLSRDLSNIVNNLDSGVFVQQEQPMSLPSLPQQGLSDGGIFIGQFAGTV